MFEDDYLLARERVMMERKKIRKSEAAAMAGANISSNALYKSYAHSLVPIYVIWIYKCYMYRVSCLLLDISIYLKTKLK